MTSRAAPPTHPVRDAANLTSAEKRMYNSMADHMDRFHNHFRYEWRTLASNTNPALPKPTGSAKLSASGVVNLGLQFLGHLSTHHNIEETYIFPVLAKRMPAFRARAEADEAAEKAEQGAGLEAVDLSFAPDRDRLPTKEEVVGASEGEKLGRTQEEKEKEDIATMLIEQHKQIHHGMDQLEKYLRACKQGERDFRREEVWDAMKGWEKVLWTHLDQEVNELGWKNMCNYWTAEEMMQMPM